MLNEYIKLVELLGKLVPNNVEVVLHDVRNIKNSIVAIENGHVSGRKLGMPVTDFTLEILNSEQLKKETVISDYQTVSKNGIILTSHTFLVKEKNNLVALLCFNIDANSVIKPLNDIANLLQNYLTLSTNQESKVIETFIEDEDELFSSQIQSVILEYNVTIDNLTVEQKQDIVKRLNQKGLFLVKGSVAKVASALEVSNATLYRYLQNVK